jgi:hypothetical protein
LNPQYVPGTGHEIALTAGDGEGEPEADVEEEAQAEGLVLPVVEADKLTVLVPVAVARAVDEVVSVADAEPELLEVPLSVSVADAEPEVLEVGPADAELEALEVSVVLLVAVNERKETVALLVAVLERKETVALAVAEPVLMLVAEPSAVRVEVMVGVGWL